MGTNNRFSILPLRCRVCSYKHRELPPSQTQQLSPKLIGNSGRHKHICKGAHLAAPRGLPNVLFLVLVMLSVPFRFVSGLAAEFGAVECFWRESERSFTGFVAEVWFAELSVAAQFAQRWSGVVGYSVLVRCVSVGPGRFVASVPVVVPQGQVRLSQLSRGSRVRLVV